MTKSALAAAADVSLPTIRTIEDNITKKPKSAVLKRISMALGMPPDWLETGEVRVEGSAAWDGEERRAPSQESESERFDTVVDFFHEELPGFDRSALEDALSRFTLLPHDAKARFIEGIFQSGPLAPPESINGAKTKA